MNFDFIKTILMWFGAISFAIFILGMAAMYSADEFEKMLKNYKHRRAIRKANLLPKCPVAWKFIESIISNGERIDAAFFIGNNIIIGKLIIGTKANGLWDITAFEFAGINSDHGFDPKLKTAMFLVSFFAIVTFVLGYMVYLAGTNIIHGALSHGF